MLLLIGFLASTLAVSFLIPFFWNIFQVARLNLPQKVLEECCLSVTKQEVIGHCMEMLLIYWSPGLWLAWSSDPLCRSPVANPGRRRADPWPSPPACSPDAAPPHLDRAAPSPSGGTTAGAVGRRPAPGCWRLPSSSSCRCADSVTRLGGERSGEEEVMGSKEEITLKKKRSERITPGVRRGDSIQAFSHRNNLMCFHIREFLRQHADLGAGGQTALCSAWRDLLLGQE